MRFSEDPHEYLSFAEQEYEHLEWTYKMGRRDGTIAIMGQSACEKYLKDFINKWYIDFSDETEFRKYNVLHTHNMQILIDFIDLIRKRLPFRVVFNNLPVEVSTCDRPSLGLQCISQS